MHSSSSSSSSSRTNNTSDNNKPTTKSMNTANSNTKLVIIGLPISTLNPSSLLFFKSTPLNTENHCNNKPILNFHRIVAESSHSFIRNLHNSIDKCLGFLHHFASNNPLFTKLDSVASEYRKFGQINRRNHMNLNHLPRHNFAAIIPGDSLAGLVVSNGISNFLNIYNTLLVVRLVLTWFPNTPPAIVSPLSTLCDPYLNIFRGLIPPLGGTLDLSPILAFLVLNALTSTASALPAELPSTNGPSSETSPDPSFFTAISHLTTSQKKWLRRFDSNRSNGSSVDD